MRTEELQPTDFALCGANALTSASEVNKVLTARHLDVRKMTQAGANKSLPQCVGSAGTCDDIATALGSSPVKFLRQVRSNSVIPTLFRRELFSS